MSYIDSNLIGNEEVIYRGKVTLWAWLPWIVWGLILGFATLVGFVLIPLGYFILRSNEAAITNKRLIAKSGLIKRDTVEIPIKKISSLQIKQDISGRLLGYGSLVISDTGAVHAPIRYIKDPMKFRQRFFELQEEIENKQS
ncbi:TPA: PH domain-containing protein [Enterobacter roggenkampii]|uniref:PH domain-containing protein n=1 Tax=Enterobacter TaxID=547 RepID=UPI0007974B4B|nr:MULTISPECIES: PH domain-containing protein [Enterobacter]MCC7577987.1 PH domain-containing protein [Enterobacter roggenkampii]MCC7586867.1 PH domain-containing protein [Enterobacter roggenkampii]MCC7591911.1 PH domain-containing protein [Enterobacter roggenkampii]MCC7601495.1 PH domain-containing protein [Enterobacter roggenkampii]MCC7606095.1 PH domain-containing protein [Enterobacter roggenkampii]